ncbi:phage tail assembly chaperone [Ralstonia sp. ASV6]|uniref:phage tail assembly chaperone n=1 Tax=Ralstonia sp. ASV6 TaxID=2795124 RepID=UPI0018EAE4B3|nr:phage tail assembly chaperone [Ralstonia sp. ASV6]
MFYSKSTGGFYDADVHGARTLTVVDPSWIRPTVMVPDPQWAPATVEPTLTEVPLIEVPDMSAVEATVTVPNPESMIPEDAVEISDEVYQALLAAQSAGMRIVADAEGNPIAVDPPPPSADERAAALRAKRDRLLESTQWLVIRHRDQLEAGFDPSLTGDQFQRVLIYRQALRDVSKQAGFPDVAMPELSADLSALMKAAR